MCCLSTSIIPSQYGLWIGNSQTSGGPGSKEATHVWLQMQLCDSIPASVGASLLMAKPSTSSPLTHSLCPPGPRPSQPAPLIILLGVSRRHQLPRLTSLLRGWSSRCQRPVRPGNGCHLEGSFVKRLWSSPGPASTPRGEGLVCGAVSRVRVTSHPVLLNLEVPITVTREKPAPRCVGQELPQVMGLGRQSPISCRELARIPSWV